MNPDDKKDVYKKMMSTTVNEMLTVLKEHLSVLKTLDFDNQDRVQFFMNAQVNFICSTHYLSADQGREAKVFDDLIKAIQLWFKKKTQAN